MGVTAAVVGVTVGSGLYSANAQRKAGRQQQRVADFNARVAEVQAQDAIMRGEFDVQRSWQDTQRFVGAQRAAAAGQNVIVDQDSVGALVDETRAIGAKDMETLRYNAAMEAWGYRVEGKDQSMRGQIARRTANNQAMGTLITSGVQAYQQAVGGARTSGMTWSRG